jgi:predicted esterase
LHGYGGRPERFDSLWQNMPVRIDVAMPQGFVPIGEGYSWYHSQPGTGVEGVATAIVGAEERVWRGVVAEAHGRKILVGGFSQGAIIAYALAARHPEIVSAFPIAGVLPTEIFPPSHARMAPVFAMHGTEDTVIPFDDGRRTVAAFRALGGKAELLEFPGVGHEITEGMRNALYEHIEAVAGDAVDRRRAISDTSGR